MKILSTLLVVCAPMLAATEPSVPISQVPRYTFLEKARVVVLADLTADAKTVYIKVREVWKGPVHVGEVIQIPEAHYSGGVISKPWVVVVSIADYPNLKTWSAQGTDGVRIGGQEPPSVQQLRDYFEKQANRAPDRTASSVTPPASTSENVRRDKAQEPRH